MESFSQATSSSSEEHRKKRKRKKHSKKSEKNKKKKHRRKEDDFSSSDGDRKRKRHERRRHEDKRRKKHKKSSKHSPEPPKSPSSSRETQLLDSLFDMFEEHPALSSDLPIMLVRLVQGSCFDLSNMTDKSAAHHLGIFFTKLEEFGVCQGPTGWSWKAPQAGNKDELILVKVIRALMDEVGFTKEAIDEFEGGESWKAKQELEKQKVLEEARIRATQKLVRSVETLLGKFTEGNLSTELAGLCEIVVNGESIALDGIPDSNLRESLEEIFSTCGLEKVEMEDSDEEDDGNGEPLMGYCLPERPEDALLQLKTMVNACTSYSSETGKSKRALKGPLPHASDYAVYDNANGSDDSEDEGPSQFGVRQTNSTNEKLIKEAADQRARELMAAKGIDLPQDARPGTREEWMVEPGKFDFLSAVKAKPTKSRQFESKQVPGASEAQTPIEPGIASEINAIMQAHRDGRGPSLVEKHTAAKAEKNRSQSESWKWNRNEHLDAGRRVDKNALNMVLGGASDDLKKKFQGGAM